MPEPAPIDVHKALADDTRYRLYRYLRLSGRPVPVRELATRLSLHPNTIRPHLRRLEEVGLVASEARKQTTVGRPQTLYAAIDTEGREGRDFRLLADILAGLLSAPRQRARAQEQAREWGAYLAGRSAPKPGVRKVTGQNLAVIQEALAEAGFTPRFRRRKGGRTVEITLRDCPFRELLEDHRELVCSVHRGLLEGILAGARPPLAIVAFEPLADRSSTCRLVASAAKPRASD
jgi:predicted ArsR family transcriptional regulator